MLVPLVLAAALAGVYLVWVPSSGDLAAHVFRSDLFSAHGFLIWNNDWYGGHYLPGYSVLFPPLGGWFDPRVVGAVSVVLAAGLFTSLARRRYGDRGAIGTIWFAAATFALLLTAQLTFALGVAIGLAAMLALQRGRGAIACVLAGLCSIASPVAGLFTMLAAVAAATGDGRRRALATGFTALAAIAVFGFAFPTDGYFPFDFTAYFPIPLVAAAALLLLPPEERALRRGAVLYAVVATALYFVETPVGGNASRLGALFAGPILAVALVGRRNLALALIAPFILYWQWNGPIGELTDAVGDPSVHRSFYAPLLAELDTLTAGQGAVRVEIPPTEQRWEAVNVAPRFALARGWLRQSESEDFDLFKGGNLDATSYRAWLDDHGVSYVAMSRAELEYMGRDEGALIGGGLPYLDAIWSNADWRLYAVSDAAGLVQRPARLLAVEPDSFTLDVPHPGSYLVRFHYTRYWTVSSGDACVEKAGDWTRVVADSAGTIAVEARFSLDRLLGGDQTCSG